MIFHFRASAIAFLSVVACEDDDTVRNNLEEHGDSKLSFYPSSRHGRYFVQWSGDGYRLFFIRPI
ncbi:hypothetical protein BKA67DRAFT_558826 [Truncatella angustata]|uniref:Uncharacterized protein n=1 Tax=Truncatella angustata TaxID=152316 RepID=A0A9P8UUG3_9PEZI|nr:uncharacterized protein BKA67DRAFT_558826 [Truncatella angustata]KAH6658722.1 hypothetical protein BKA67DRAFT_558826 [Truncatella angustata]